MIEAVENHMPEVIVIDEIGRMEETMAARTIAERGVQLIATVHGNTLDNLLANPSMSDLVGGIQAVTLSDEEARRRRTQKTVLERKAPPTFGVVIEMIERDKIAVRRPLADVVDALLRGQAAPPEIRWRDENGDINIMQPAPLPEPDAAADWTPREERGNRRNRGGSHSHANGHTAKSGFEKRATAANGVYYATKTVRRAEPVLDEEPEEALNKFNDPEGSRDPFHPGWGDESDETEEYEEVIPTWQSQPVDLTKIKRVYPFGLSRSRLARAAKHLGINITPARTWHEADAVLMLTGEEGLPATSSMLREARELQLPIIGVGGNTYGQIVARLNDLYNAPGTDGNLSARDLAMQEAKEAAARVLQYAEPVELRPTSKPLRKVQHQMAERYHLKSFSIGRDPNRRVKFMPAPGR
jgi:hypothetical protein